MGNDATYEMFVDEHSRWREMSGNKSFTCEQLDRVFADFFRTYNRAMANPEVTITDKQKMEQFIPAVTNEHSKRQAYRVMLEMKL